MKTFKRSRFTVDLPIEFGPIESGTDKQTALYQTMTGAFALIPEEEWGRILSTTMTSVNPETVEQLYEQGFLIKDGVDESALFEYWKQQQVHDYTTISSKVLVTRKCNNSCRYCIIDYEATDMTPANGKAMDNFYIETIKDRRPLRVQDDYLGGEPLLNPGIIQESAARRFKYCRGNNIEYGFGITTNGTLLYPSLITHMKKVGLEKIRVSMAGPASVHDLLRPSKNNGGTYDVIMKNLQSVSGMIPITIECQYDSGTDDFKKISEMLDDFTNKNIDIQNVFFTPILKKRGKSSFHAGIGDPEIAISLMQMARKKGCLQKYEAPSSRCRADFLSMFVFDTDGSIIPCPSLQQGEMAYGHVSKGVDFVEESQLITRKLPDKCINDCYLLPICMGGCRQQGLVHENDFNAIDCQYDAHRLYLEHYIRETALEYILKQDSSLIEKAA